MKKSEQTPDEVEFYESLPGMASVNLPGAESMFGRLESGAGKLGKFFVRSLEHVAVGWYDTTVLTRTAVRKATGRTALKLYLLILASGTATIGVGVFALANATYSAYANDLASPSALINKKKTGTTILDRNGQVLYKVYGAMNQDPISIDQAPEHLVNATLAAEDSEFFNHPGFSVKGVTRALYKNATGSAVEGGSTITQQLVKNTLLTPDRSLMRKAQEITLAIELERRYDKRKIMEMYLNGIYYGQGSQGVGTAAATYFKKEVKDLTIAESAMLAGLPLGPTRFDPAIYPETALARRNFVIERMADLGFITAEQADRAKHEPIEASARQIQIEAPHFVFYVLNQLREKYGDETIEHGGITVHTTLDLGKQKIAEAAVSQHITRLKGRGVGNGALVSLNPNTGEIESMVGSYDYNDPNYGSVNVVTSERQPGSAMKPLVYLAAFAKGWNGATTVNDKPLQLPDGQGGIYKPQNYDQKFRGTVTLRRALANSLNIPAIEVLRFVGIPDALKMSHDLGITTLNQPERYGVSLVLGGGEVKMIDLAAAYAVFASGGQRIKPVAVTKVVDRYDKDITSKEVVADPKTPIVDPRLAYMLTNILSDNRARREIFGANTPMDIGRPAAVKTGTTNDYRDNWTAGYTPDAVTVVWAGNNDNSPMQNVDGLTGAAPIWHDYMIAIHKNLPVKDFVRPEGLVVARVCTHDGGLANAWDTNSTEEVFLKEAVPKKQCGTQNPETLKKPEAEKTDEKPAPQTDKNLEPVPPPKPKEEPAPTPTPEPEPSPKPDADGEI